MSKKILIALIVIAIAGVGVYKGKSLIKKRQTQIANEPMPKESVISVIVTKAKEARVTESAQFLAKVKADKSISLATKIPGYIKKIYVSESDLVNEGDLLVQIDESEILSNIKALNSTLSMQEADRDVTQKVYERNKKLFEIGGISKEQLEMSQVALKGKKAQVENTKQKILQLKNQLEYLKIKAPFSGVVDKLALHEGDLAVVGKPIVVLSTTKKKLLFNYSASKYDIKPSLEVFVGNNLVGRVKKIYASATNALSTAEVELDSEISNPNESEIEIRVVQKSEFGCRVPLDTLMHKEGAVYLLEYDEKHFIPKKVDVLLSDDRYALISPCSKKLIARANETKLSQLPAYNDIKIVEEKDEQVK